MKVLVAIISLFIISSSHARSGSIPYPIVGDHSPPPKIPLADATDLDVLTNDLVITVRETSRPTIPNPNHGRYVWEGRFRYLENVVSPDEIEHGIKYYVSRWCPGKSAAVLSVDLVGIYHDMSHPVSLIPKDGIPSFCDKYDVSSFIHEEENDNDTYQSVSGLVTVAGSMLPKALKVDVAALTQECIPPEHIEAIRKQVDIMNKQHRETFEATQFAFRVLYDTVKDGEEMNKRRPKKWPRLL